MGHIHIHAPPVLEKAAVATTCPDCGKHTRMLGFYQEWYGWRSTCLRCGRMWDDGEWLPLDFARGVRQRNIEDAKRRWRAISAPRISPTLRDLESDDCDRACVGAGAV